MESGKQLITVKNVITALVSALLKGLVMGLTISLWLLPTFIPAESPLRGKMKVFQTMFSVNQFLTACIGMVYVFIILTALKHTLSSKNPS